MSDLNLITIIVFSIGVLVTGLLFGKTGKSVRGFFSADGNVPWVINGISLFIGFFSAGTFVVWGSIAYSQGLVGVMIQSMMCLAGFLVAFFLAAKWKRAGILTVAEYIDRRLGSKAQRIYIYLFLFVSIFTSGAFLYPVAKILEVSTGISIYTFILAIGLFSIIYVSIGGLRAVVITDVLQFVILTAAILIVIPMSFKAVGGWTGFMEKVPEGFFSPVSGEYTYVFLFFFMLYNAVFLGGNWSYVQRYTTVKDERSSRKVALTFACLYIISPFLWMLPPMLYRCVDPTLSVLEGEGAYMNMCQLVLPDGLLGLMLGGMVFATASSLNGVLNISAGVFTNDIYKKLFPTKDEKKYLSVARYSTVMFGLAAIAVAMFIPSMGGIVNVVISIAALTGVPLYLPVIWSLFSKRQNGKSAATVTLLSLSVNIAVKFLYCPLTGEEMSKEFEMVMGVMVPLVLLCISELVLYFRKKECDPEILCAVRHPVQVISPESMENSETNNRFSLKVLGFSIAITGLFITGLGFYSAGFSANPPVIVGGLVLLTGCGLILSLFKKNK